MLMNAIATQLHAASRRSNRAGYPGEGKSHAGLRGLAAGYLLSALARRTPMGAAFVAGLLVARRFYNHGRDAQDRKPDNTINATPSPSRAERLAANGQSARRPIDRTEKTASRRKPRLATLH